MVGRVGAVIQPARELLGGKERKIKREDSNEFDLNFGEGFSRKDFFMPQLNSVKHKNEKKGKMHMLNFDANF